jgi:hypothetical protein
MKPKPALAATFDSGILLPPLVTSPPSVATYLPLSPVQGKPMQPYAGEQLFFQAASDATSHVLTLTVSNMPFPVSPDASAPATTAQLTVNYLGGSMISDAVPVNWPGGAIDFSLMLNGDRTLAFLQFEPTVPPDDAIPLLGFIVLEEDDPVGQATTKMFFISDAIPVPQHARRENVAVVRPANKAAGGGTGILGPMGIDFGAPQ